MSGAARPAAGTLALLAVAVVAVSMSGPVMASLVVPALVISFWRNAMASVLLAPVALATRREELRSLLTRGRRRELGGVVLAGAFLAAHFGFWVTSLRMTTVAASTAIVCTQIAWVVLWHQVTGRREPARVVLGVVVAFAGVLVITGVDLQVSTRALVGDLLALVGAVAVAAYTLAGARARRTVSTTAYTLVCYSTAAVILLVAALVAGQPVVGFSAGQWALLLLVTLTAQLLGHSVLNHLLDTLSPVVISLTLLLEIPGAALIAAALLGQVPSAGVFAGLVLIVAGMAVVVLAGGDGPVAEEAVEATPG